LRDKKKISNQKEKTFLLGDFFTYRGGQEKEKREKLREEKQREEQYIHQ